MNLSVRTTYDYKCLQDFNLGFTLKNKKHIFIPVLAVDILLILTNIINGVMWGLDSMDIGVMICSALLNALLFGMYAYNLTVGIKKTKALNCVHTVTFTDEGIGYSAEDASGTNSGTLSYPSVMRVERYKLIYAIYIDRNAAHLVSRTALAEQCSECEFESFLAGVLGADKLRFKRKGPSR